jgi:DnaJ-class molecular chaperone
MNPYDILGVSSGASDEDIAKAYKSLAKKYHPDLNPGNEAAAKKMGEINRAYEDIKSMRQRGQTYQNTGNGYGNAQTAYGNPFDPFASAYQQAYRTYTYTYNSQRPRHNPITVILAVMVMTFLVRLLLSMLFGGFGGSYYVNDRNMAGQGVVVPGYGYYDRAEP